MAVNLLIVRAIGANPGQITKFFEEYKNGWTPGAELHPK